MMDQIFNRINLYLYSQKSTFYFFIKDMFVTYLFCPRNAYVCTYMYIYIVTYCNFYLKKAKSKFCFNKIHFEYFFINSIEEIEIY